MIPDLLPLKPYLRETVWGGRSPGNTLQQSTSPGRAHWRIVGSLGIQRDWKALLQTAHLPDTTSPTSSQLTAQTSSDSALSSVTAPNFHCSSNSSMHAKTSPSRYTPTTPTPVQKTLGTYGKTEAWYVLKSDHGRVACGLKDGVDKHSLKLSIRENRVQDTVQFFDVQEGDVIFVPPGTVHALCQNVMIYEVQQSSDLTFRIYDYNRPGTDGKPRELHIDRALDRHHLWRTRAKTAELTPRYKTPHSSARKTPNTSTSNALPQ